MLTHNLTSNLNDNFEKWKPPDNYTRTFYQVHIISAEILILDDKLSNNDTMTSIIAAVIREVIKEEFNLSSR